MICNDIPNLIFRFENLLAFHILFDAETMVELDPCFVDGYVTARVVVQPTVFLHYFQEWLYFVQRVTVVVPLCWCLQIVIQMEVLRGF